jgi:hypothetical protein
MILRLLELHEFNQIAENAHLLAFHEERSQRVNTYDFALLVEDEKTDTLLGYMACMEVDAESVWILHGGAFPPAKNNSRAVQGFNLMVSYLKQNYARAKLDTLSSNIAMIKLAYSAGFMIAGTDLQGPNLYVILAAEFGDGL